MNDKIKISKEELIEMIKEEMEILLEDIDGKAFGRATVTRGQAAKTLRQKASEMSGQQGVDAKERAIIAQVEKLMAALADKGDLKKGNVFVQLRKIHAILGKELQTMSKGQQDEE